MLINNVEFQIYCQLYSDHDYKWSHVFSNSEIEVVLSSCFGKNCFFYFSCTWNSSEVKPDVDADQFKETNKAWDTSILACDKNSIFFFILESLLPGGFLVPPLHFFRKCGFRVTLQKLPYLCHSGTFGAAFCAKIVCSLCTLNAYSFGLNAICARVLLGLSNEGYFLGDFWKISLGVPFALFQKIRVLGDLAKIGHPGTFGAVICANIISYLCTLSAN